MEPTCQWPDCDQTGELEMKPTGSDFPMGPFCAQHIGPALVKHSEPGGTLFDVWQIR